MLRARTLFSWARLAKLIEGLGGGGGTPWFLISLQEACNESPSNFQKMKAIFQLGRTILDEERESCQCKHPIFGPKLKRQLTSLNKQWCMKEKIRLLNFFKLFTFWHRWIVSAYFQSKVAQFLLMIGRIGGFTPSLSPRTMLTRQYSIKARNTNLKCLK